MSQPIKTWMYDDTFKFYQDGLRKLFAILNEYSAPINSLNLKDMSFSKDIEKLRKVIDWTARVYSDSRHGEVEFTCSLETLAVLKAGGVAQIILLERERDIYKRQKAPKKLIENIDEKLSKYRELIEMGVFKDTSPDEIIEYLYESEPVYVEKEKTIDSKEYEYDIALSFAGEDRKYADEIAHALKIKEISVFYDKYEQADLWGVDLYTHLSTIYKDKAKFCLMFLSQHYAKKAWTSHERKNAQARAFLEQKEYILPLRIDDTEIPGILPTVGYIDINKFTTDEIVDMILLKLKKSK